MTAPAIPAAGERAATDALAATSPSFATDNFSSDVPTIETAAYTRSKPRWKKCRDVYGGTESIRDGRTLYLPRFRFESDAQYDARRTIAGFFNGFARTVDATVGLVCEPGPVLSEDMGPTLVTMWENVDGAGMHGDVFTRHLVGAGTVDGFAGIITEYPRPDQVDLSRDGVSADAVVAIAEGRDFNAEDVRALGIRPYFILVKADEVLPIYETMNGKRTLVMLIRQSVATERKGRFGRSTVVRYDVYEIVKGKVMYERWTVGTDGGNPIMDIKPTELRNLTGIPWSPLALGKKLGENEYKPTLIELADLCIEHHRIKTGILSLEEEGCVPTMVRVGAQPDENGDYPPVLKGSSEVIEVPATVGVSTPVYYTSPDVDVLNPAMRSLETNKAEQGAMGASFLTPQPQNPETATAARMDATAETASISLVSRDTKDCLESAFGFAAEYVQETAGSITMNNDFVGDGIDPAALTVFLKAYTEGSISLEELRHVLQTGQLPEDFKSDDARVLNALARQAAVNAAKDAAAAAAKAAAQNGDGQADGGAV